jgi:hypothetical protein
MAKKKRYSSAFPAEGPLDNVLDQKEQDSVLRLQPNMLRFTREVFGPKIDKTEFVVHDSLLTWISSSKSIQQLSLK